MATGDAGIAECAGGYAERNRSEAPSVLPGQIVRAEDTADYYSVRLKQAGCPNFLFCCVFSRRAGFHFGGKRSGIFVASNTRLGFRLVRAQCRDRLPLRFKKRFATLSDFYPMPQSVSSR